MLRFTSDGRFLGVAAGADIDVAPAGSVGVAPAKPRKGGSRRARTIASPSGLAFADDGTLWVASYATGAVTRFNSSYGGGRTFWRVTE